MSRIEGWKGFTTVFRTSWSRCPLLATAWTPDLQDLGPGCVYEDVTGTLELDMFTLESIDLAFRRETTTNQAMPLALLLGIWRPEFLPDLSWNSDDTASQVNYGTCHFPKWLVLDHLCTFVHTLLYPEMSSSGSSPVKTGPFSQYLLSLYLMPCKVVICMLFLFAFLQIASPLEKKGLWIFAHTYYHMWWSF